MEITSIIVRRISQDSKMKAVVSITFDDAFVVHDVKVIEGVRGLFIAMPSRKTLEGEFKDIVHPINSDFRDALSEAVLEKYQSALQDYNTAATGRGEARYRDAKHFEEKKNNFDEEEYQDISLAPEQGFHIDTP